MITVEAARKWANRMYLNWRNDGVPILVYRSPTGDYSDIVKDLGNHLWEQGPGARQGELVWNREGADAVAMVKEMYDYFDRRRQRYADVFMQSEYGNGPHPVS